MAAITRHSPARLPATSTEAETRDHWTVALAYADEGDGPWLADLSHKTRWDLQDGMIDGRTVCGLSVPATPGRCVLDGDTLISRMNRTQAAVCHLGVEAPAMPDDPAYTDVGEATLLVALFGPQTFSIAEKLTHLDLMDPGRETPFLLQGPFGHVPCQIVVLEKGEDGSGGFLLAGSRGYGKSMVDAVLAAGEEFGLRPAGEDRFADWVLRLPQGQGNRRGGRR